MLQYTLSYTATFFIRAHEILLTSFYIRTAIDCSLLRNLKYLFSFKFFQTFNKRFNYFTDLIPEKLVQWTKYERNLSGFCNRV